MTSKFPDPDHSSQPEEDFSLEDRFELLSAYLDRELSVAQKKEVQAWLDNDPQTKEVYLRLLTLRQALQNMPVPEPEISPEQLSNQVFAKIDRRQRQSRLWWLGGGAIAAIFLGAISGILPGMPKPLLQMALEQPKEDLVIAINNPTIKIVEPELMIPLDRPAVAIPDS